MRTASLFGFLTGFLVPAICSGALFVGTGKADITPPIGTPSAGYAERKGEGMTGVHDPLMAIALFIDNGQTKLVFCSVDHLGFTYEMVQEVLKIVEKEPGLSDCELFLASSHTHSGGGAFLNIPFLGESLAGVYNAEITRGYIEKTAAAVIDAYRAKKPGKVGIGYGKADEISQYRGLFPSFVEPVADVALIKVTDLDGKPVAALFNYAIHPTILKSQNRLFSSDFVGYARDHIQSLVGKDVQPLYVNGAQGDIIPLLLKDEDRFEMCELLGQALAETVVEIWENTEVEESLDMNIEKMAYSFKPRPTPFGLSLPVEQYETEINALILNQTHAFITIPGELSCVYDREFKEFGKELGFTQVSVLGLTNDAHGYIITPASWNKKTFEAALSFGGAKYGETTEIRVKGLLEKFAPEKKIEEVKEIEERAS